MFLLGSLFIGFIVFGVGYVVGYAKACKDESNVSNIPDAYCFQCEIEMPVKEKKGWLSCSNCGLRHGKYE